MATQAPGGSIHVGGHVHFGSSLAQGLKCSSVLIVRSLVSMAPSFVVDSLELALARHGNGVLFFALLDAIHRCHIVKIDSSAEGVFMKSFYDKKHTVSSAPHTSSISPAPTRLVSAAAPPSCSASALHTPLVESISLAMMLGVRPHCKFREGDLGIRVSSVAAAMFGHESADVCKDDALAPKVNQLMEKTLAQGETADVEFDDAQMFKENQLVCHRVSQVETADGTIGDAQVLMENQQMDQGNSQVETATIISPDPSFFGDDMSTIPDEQHSTCSSVPLASGDDFWDELGKGMWSGPFKGKYCIVYYRSKDQAHFKSVECNFSWHSKASQYKRYVGESLDPSLGPFVMSRHEDGYSEVWTRDAS